MTKLKKNKKGFTLVEIIVVLVILAILAAIAIPTMIGFVDDAQGKAEISNARAAYLACQMIATEESKTADADKTLKADTEYTIGGTAGAAINVNARLDSLLSADLKGAKVKVEFDATNTSKINKVVYISTDGDYTVTIAGGNSTVTETP